MAKIIIADSTGHYDGRDLECRPLGGTETSVIRCARTLLTDDGLWRRQHEAALRQQQGIDWAEHAARLEQALLREQTSDEPFMSEMSRQTELEA